MSHILSREGAAPLVSELFFKAVFQAILLFREETLVVTLLMGNALGGFQTQVERWLTGRLPRRTLYGRWRYTLAAAAREEARFLTIE